MSDKEKAAREYSDDYKTLVPIDRTWAQISDTITLVSRESFLAGAEWAEKQPKWIKCSERLPEKYGSYFVNIINHRIEIAIFSSAWCLSGCDGAGLEGDITHWMPLPDAPKEEE